MALIFFSHTFFLFTVTLYLLHLSFVCTSCLIVLYVRINTEYMYIDKSFPNKWTHELHSLICLINPFKKRRFYLISNVLGALTNLTGQRNTVFRERTSYVNKIDSAFWPWACWCVFQWHWVFFGRLWVSWLGNWRLFPLSRRRRYLW